MASRPARSAHPAARLTFLLLVLAGCAAGPHVRLRYDLLLPEQRATLDNGLRVIAMPDRTTDLVAIVVRYDVGYKEDPPRAVGLAHLVEHLTYQLRPGAISIHAEVRERTIFANAYTELASTRYVALAHPSQLDALLRLEAARLTAPCAAISPASFATEKAVVGEELRSRSGLAERVRTDVLASFAGPGHPLARSDAAEEAALARLTLDDACRFLSDHYVPERATVVLAGNLPDDALALATRWLAPLPRRAPAPRTRLPRLASAARFAELRVPGAGAAVYAFWPVPDDVPESVLPFIIAVLDSGNPAMEPALRRAIAHHAQVIRLGPSRTIMAYVVFPDNADAPYGQDAFLYSNDTSGTVRAGLNFERLRYSLLTRDYLDWQGLISRAEAVAELASDERGEPLAARLRAVRDLDAETASRDIARVLHKDNMIVRVATTEPRGDDPAPEVTAAAPRAVLDEDDEDDEDDELGGELEPPVPAIRSPLERATVDDILENGLQVVLLPRSSPFPVVSARLVLPVGSAHASPGQDLVPSAAAALIAPRPRRYETPTGAVVAHSLYIAGARHDVVVTPDATVARADGLSDSLGQLLEGLEDWATGELASPVEYGDAVVAFVLRNMPAYADRSTLDVLQQAVYGPDHPYARRSAPTSSTLDQLEPSLLRRWQDEHFHATGATLVVTGSFDPREASRLIRRIFGGWRSGTVAPAIHRPPAPRAAATFEAIAAATRNVEVIVAFASPPASDANHAAVQAVLKEVIGRSVRALRDRLGASYGVASFLASRVGPGMQIVRGDVALERAQEAIDAIRDRLHGPAQRAQLARHFAAGRRAALAHLAVEIDDCAALANALAAHGHHPEAGAGLIEAVLAVTPESVVDLATHEIRADHERIVVRGPRAVLEKLRIGKRAPTFVDPFAEGPAPDAR